MECFGKGVRRQTTQGSMTRESRGLKRPQTKIPEKLAAIGVKENVLQGFYKGMTQPFMPFQMRGEQFIRHPHADKLFDIRYKVNFSYLFAGILLWATFVGAVVYEVVDATCSIHGLTACRVSQRQDSFAWESEAAPLDVFLRTDSMANLKAEIRACNIVNGNFGNHLTHANKNPPEIHPEEGGCEIPPSMLVTGDLVTKPPSEGGCLLFGDDQGFHWCQRLSGAKVLGQFGDPNYNHIVVTLKAKIKDLIANGNWTTISFVVPEIVGDGTREVWTSMFYTFDPFKPITKELFFQKVEVENGEGTKKQFTQYHHEFNRWTYTPPLEEVLAQGVDHEVTVATLYLRATTSRVEVQEWYTKTIWNVPQVLGGLFTFLFAAGNIVFFGLHHVCPKRLAAFEELRPSAHGDNTFEKNIGCPEDKPPVGITLLEKNSADNDLKNIHALPKGVSQSDDLDIANNTPTPSTSPDFEEICV